VNPIAGKWMFIPLELIIIGFDPPPNSILVDSTPLKNMSLSVGVKWDHHAESCHNARLQKKHPRYKGCKFFGRYTGNMMSLSPQSGYHL